jgi:hypothetical protein
MKDQHWTDPTPVSRRQEARRVGHARRVADRGPGASSSPAPVPYTLTAQELAQVAELSQSGVVRPARDQHPAAVTYRADRTGEPCLCSDLGPCALHEIVRNGRRRNVRPGRHHGSHNGDRGRPDLPPEYDA